MNASASKSADDDETTQQFWQTLTNFATNMAESETNYIKMSTESSQQTSQMAASLQSMQQGLAQLTQQMAMMSATSCAAAPTQHRPVQKASPIRAPSSPICSPHQQYATPTSWASLLPPHNAISPRAGFLPTCHATATEKTAQLHEILQILGLLLDTRLRCESHQRPMHATEPGPRVQCHEEELNGRQHAKHTQNNLTERGWTHWLTTRWWRRTMRRRRIQQQQ